MPAKLFTLRFAPPSLASVAAEMLPNNAFERGRCYAVQRTRFGHWPVYRKVQNIRVSTEVKRVAGNVERFAEEIKEVVAGKIRVNKATGEVNVGGDHVAALVKFLEQRYPKDS